MDLPFVAEEDKVKKKWSVACGKRKSLGTNMEQGGVLIHLLRRVGIRGKKSMRKKIRS